jgi:hypothetical protein
MSLAFSVGTTVTRMRSSRWTVIKIRGFDVPLLRFDFLPSLRRFGAPPRYFQVDLNPAWSGGPKPHPRN